MRRRLYRTVLTKTKGISKKPLQNPVAHADRMSFSDKAPYMLYGFRSINVDYIKVESHLYILLREVTIYTINVRIITPTAE